MHADTLKPEVEKYGLISQRHRAAVSIRSNSAEECARDTQRDLKWFLQNAVDTACELETQLTVSQHVDLLKKNMVEPILLVSSKKMIDSSISSVKTRKATPKI
jgi:four helix bundle protein